MQVMDNGGATQVKEIFTKTTIACSPSLPSPNMGQGMLNSNSLTQFGPSHIRKLKLSQLAE
jgi:hypothetical protein